MVERTTRRIHPSPETRHTTTTTATTTLTTTPIKTWTGVWILLRSYRLHYTRNDSRIVERQISCGTRRPGWYLCIYTRRTGCIPLHPIPLTDCDNDSKTIGVGLGFDAPPMDAGGGTFVSSTFPLDALYDTITAARWCSFASRCHGG